MRAIISLVVSFMFLSLGAHAGSATKHTLTDDYTDDEKNLENKQRNSGWQKQKMENSEEPGQDPGFEKNPRPYTPDSTPQERVQTED